MDQAPDPAQRHQIEQDALTAAWEAELLAACIQPIALLREIADLERNDDGDVIVGADANGHNDLMSRITDLLATHDQYCDAPSARIAKRATMIMFRMFETAFW
jgi:hypothetical protein